MLAADSEATVELHHLGPIDDSAEMAILRSTGRLEIHSIQTSSLLEPPLVALLERIPRGSHAATSNLLRVALLHRRGGVYLDLDTFVLRPLTALAPGAFVGLERVWRHDRQRVESGLSVTDWPSTAMWGLFWALKRADTAVTRGRLRMAGFTHRFDQRLNTEQLNNAVIGAPAGSPLTAALLEQMCRRNPTVRFALGPALLHDVIAADHRLATVMHPDIFYGVPPSESHRFFWDRTLVLPPRAAVVHYVNSNHASLLRTVGFDDPRFGRDETFWRLARHAREWIADVATREKEQH